MVHVLRILLKNRESHPYLVVFCLLLASLAEALGVSALLPVATSMAGPASANSSPLNRYILDAVAAFGVQPSIGNLILIVTAFLVARAILSFAALSYAGIAAAQLSIRLRRRLMAAVFDARWSFYSGQRGGRFANAISNEATRAGQAYLQAAVLVAGVIQVLAYLAVTFVLSWKLALAGIMAGGLIAAMLHKLVKITRRAAFKQTDRTSELTTYMVDMVTNIKALKTMEKYEPMMVRLAVTLKRLKKAFITRELARQGLVQGSDMLTAIFVGIGAYMANRYLGTPLPELVISGIVFFQVVSLSSKVQKQLQQSMQLEGAYARIEKLIDLAEGSAEDWPGALAPAFANLCRFENVSFAHDKTPIIRAANLEIPARGITVLKGPSGAGKTTIIDL
ncbi:MAG TPA: ABC transporter ATP-binding protein, partial [Aestuariivirga sp.]|nr:ABC transporter ATP-binding protein [Aestuariivirga sp.]